MGMLLLLAGVLPLARPAHAQDKVCFPQTNQCIEGRFLEYWRQNGGLPVFGYPVSPARQELNRDTGKTYLTQWFERNRFEYHPTNPAPYKVLLGLLGNEMRGGAGPVTPNCGAQTIPELRRHYAEAVAPVRTLLGCPGPVMRDVQAAEQFFERGSMVYHAPTSPKVPVGQIYVVFGGTPARYLSTTDTWAEGVPETAGLTPPPGLREPKRGFGLVWRETPGVRDRLGWATRPERAERATLQFFQNGLMVWLPGRDYVYTFIFNSDIVTAAGRYR
jgi:hypothetical protein